MKILRIGCSVILLLALLLTSIPVLAADKPLTISYLGNATISEGNAAAMLKTKINATQSGIVTFSLTDTVYKTVIYSAVKDNVAAGDEITWTVPYYDGGMSNKKPIKLMRASFAMDGKTYSYNLYYNYAAKRNETPTVTIERNSLYTDNTACSFGPAFRDVQPGLTDKWYTFTPLDLTEQGRQTYEYVASNMYVIGEVYVDVLGDSVTVTYHNYYEDQEGKTKTLAEYFTIFPDLDSVTGVEPETMDDIGFRFGQAISIRKDLEGDTNVLLFIRNRVTYSTYVTDKNKLTRFWPNLPERVRIRDTMLEIMDK